MNAAWEEFAARHHSSHRSLLPQFAVIPEQTRHESERSLRVDAIIVPAYRPASGLDHAIDVAAMAGAVLVLMCSGQITAAAALARVRESNKGIQAVAIDTAGIHQQIPKFATDHHRPATFMRRHDANGKRNLALLLARLMGWQRVMLLNDDVRGLDRAKLQNACAQLDALMSKTQDSQSFAAVGWAFSSFPDNSVVCHAHRLVGGTQSTFVSDGALILTVSAELPYFPAIYNEDWFFLYDGLVAGRVLLAGHELNQLPYNPFARPQRAQAEEFGDVLGEGLFGLLHEPVPAVVIDEDPRKRSDTMIDPNYWQEVVEHRRRFVQDIVSRLELPGRRVAAKRSQVMASLSAALACHDPSWPLSLALWVRDWRHDVERWQELLSQVEPVENLELALKSLGIDRAGQLSAPVVARLTGSAVRPF
jgi:hypothetical protein